MDILVSVEGDQILAYRKMIDGMWTIGWLAPPMVCLLVYICLWFIREFSSLSPPLPEVTFAVKTRPWWSLASWRDACRMADRCYLYMTAVYIISSLVEQVMWRLINIPFSYCSILHYIPILALAAIRELVMKSWKIDRKWFYNEAVCAKQLKYLDRQLFLQLGTMFTLSLFGKYLCYRQLEMVRWVTFLPIFD